MFLLDMFQKTNMEGFPHSQVKQLERLDGRLLEYQDEEKQQKEEAVAQTASSLFILQFLP
ncbi:hypothetical protein AB1K83_05625 [Sporosarcina sp. 179-K 3D1 HS]|uniref:hypothetical protein n=1 Tax=Sporosarcina sp. 179-K 3D1 HS TaxID=3232169 RepID=UPI00399F239A